MLGRAAINIPVSFRKELFHLAKDTVTEPTPPVVPPSAFPDEEPPVVQPTLQPTPPTVHY
jgi:hypothetical protein